MGRGLTSNSIDFFEKCVLTISLKHLPISWAVLVLDVYNSAHLLKVI